MARLPKSIIRKYGITKKAWSVFRGRKRKSPSRTRKVKTRRKGGYKMARRKKRRGGGKSITTTAFKWLRVGALAAPAIARILEPIEPKEKIERIFQDYSGYNINDREFRFDYLARGWLPYIGTCLATYGIPKLVSIIRRL